jgi:hypothetical protein
MIKMNLDAVLERRSGVLPNLDDPGFIILYE